MSGFRAIKKQMRADLHREMRVPALYIASAGATPVPVHVRVHSKYEEVGESSERDVGNAARHERIPSLVFWVAELEASGIARPSRGAVISIEAGEAYRVDNTMPIDLVTITANVTILSPGEAKGLPVPEVA